MTIPQSASACKSKTKSIETLLGSGNLIPHIWYHKILRECGKPDIIAIIILSEVVYLYHSPESKDPSFKLNYKHFKARFNFSYDQSYEAIIRLEKKGLLHRKLSSGLNLVLDIEKIHSLSKEISAEEGKILDKEQGNIQSKGKETSYDQGKIQGITKEKSSLYYIYIDKDNLIKKSRSRSNFDEKKANFIADIVTDSGEQTYKKSLKDFYPLTEDDAEVLRAISDREFNLNFINQLLLRLAERKPNHRFLSKSSFMKYMSETLYNEIRQAVIVNNEAFRFKKEKEAQIGESDIQTADNYFLPNINCLWGRIRSYLYNHYGEGIDRSWFSKLTPIEDNIARKLLLKAPTEFVSSYVQQNYSHLIESLCKQENYQLVDIK